MNQSLLSGWTWRLPRPSPLYVPRKGETPMSDSLKALREARGCGALVPPMSWHDVAIEWAAICDRCAHLLRNDVLDRTADLAELATKRSFAEWLRSVKGSTP